MVNRIGTVYPVAQIKGSVEDSVVTYEFDTKHLKKAEEHISQNVLIIAINNPKTLSNNKTRSGLLAWIEWSICITKSKRILCLLFSWTDSVLCLYCLLV